MKPGGTKQPGPGRDHDLQRIERQYRTLENDEPPELIDRAILNRARRAVEATPARPWSFGWMHATATAALLVLGLSVVLQQRGELESTMPVPVSAGPALDELQEVKANEQQAGADAKSARAVTVGDLDGDAPAEREERAADKNESLPAQETLRSDMATGQDRRQEQDQEAGARARKVAPAATPDVSAAEGASGEYFKLPASDDAPRTSEESQVAEPGRRANIAGQAEPGENAVDVIAETVPPVMADHASADDWLTAIETMRQQGDDSAWLEELRRFVELYPDHPLPEALRQALADAGQP